MPDPTSAYRKQQGLAPITQSYDPKVVGWIVQAAKATGADPAALLATSIQESGARRGAVGDQGTSYGPFQFHRGGALGSHTPAWANTYAPVLNRAQEFKRLGVHGGPGAAAVQRPRDRALYAQGVNSHLEQARAIIAKFGLAPPTPSATATPQTRTPALPQPTAPDTVDNTLLQSLIDSSAANAGISSIQLPVATPIAPRKTPAPVKVEKPAQGTGAVDSRGQAIVEVARRYLGTKYVWGGASPKTGFDCSGLLQWAAAQSGIKIPRVTYDQIKAGKPVAPNQLQPGDAVFFGTTQNPHHVGIYIGGGKYLQSPKTGDVVKISALAGRRDFLAARRYA